MEPVECRVMATRDDYYNFAYNDPRRWLCFRLTDRENRGTCHAYVNIRTPAAQKLSELLPNSGAGEHPVTVKLAFEDAALIQGQNQALITWLVRTDWADFALD